MKNFLLAILLLIVSASFIMQSVFLYKSSTVQAVMAEEETKGDNKGTENENPDTSKDKLFTSFSTNESYSYQATTLPLSFEHFPISKGFTDKPYTPPDLG